MDIIADEEKQIYTEEQAVKKETAGKILNALKDFFEVFEQHRAAWEIYRSWTEPKEADGEADPNATRFIPEKVNKTFGLINEKITALDKKIYFSNSEAYKKAEAVRLILKDNNAEADLFQKTIEDFMDSIEIGELISFIEWVHQESKSEYKIPSSKINQIELMNDKITRILSSKKPIETNKDEESGLATAFWGINQGSGRKKAEVYTDVELSFSLDKNIELEKPLSFYDFVIQSAIAAIITNQIQNGGTLPVVFTASEVWRIMNGVQSEKDRKPGEAELERINNSILKLRNIDVTIDCREEIEKQSYTYDGELVKDGIIQDKAIDAVYGTFTLENNKQAKAFKMYRLPVIWHYNKMKRHTIVIPSEILKTIDHTGAFGLTTSFKFYILNRIENMKSGNLNNKTIRFSSLYEETGTPSPEDRLDRKKYKSESSYASSIRNQRSNDRKMVSKILESLKKKKYIAGFKITKTPSGEDSVIIKLTAADQARLDAIRKEHENKKLMPE